MKANSSSLTKKKFLDPETLTEAAYLVGELAKKADVSIALVGGFALQLMGSDRLTGDIDFAASKHIKGLPRGPGLSFGGEQTKAPNGVPVDLIIRNDDFAELYEEAIETALRVKGISVHVARPEFIAAMKMVAGRTRDTADLEFMIASGAVVPARARKVIKAYLGPYAAIEFDSLVDEVRWKKKQGKL